MIADVATSFWAAQVAALLRDQGETVLQALILQRPDNIECIEYRFLSHSRSFHPVASVDDT